MCAILRQKAMRMKAIHSYSTYNKQPAIYCIKKALIGDTSVEAIVFIVHGSSDWCRPLYW